MGRKDGDDDRELDSTSAEALAAALVDSALADALQAMLCEPDDAPVPERRRSARDRRIPEPSSAGSEGSVPPSSVIELPPDADQTSTRLRHD